MKRPRFYKASIAWTLFMLDAGILAVVWPAMLWFAGFSPAQLFEFPWDMRGFLYPACDLLLLYAMGLYRRESFVERHHAVSRIPLIVGMGALIALVLSALPTYIRPEAYEGGDQRHKVLIFALAVVWFSLCATLTRMAMDVLLSRQWLRRRILVIGAGIRAWELLHLLRHEGSSLSYDITFLHDPAMGDVDPRLECDPGIRVLRSVSIAAAAPMVGADQIVVAPDERRGMNMGELLFCKKSGFPVVQYLSFIESEIRRVDLKRIDLGWMVFSDGFYFGAIDRFLKRVFDLLVSFVMLFLTAPLMLAGIFAIRLEGRGPVFYRQERVTLDGAVFRILKLRTMRVDAEAQGAVWAAHNDNRITRVGLFLRRARIDELPQLLNILRGEMSFVGPRPERPMFVEELAAQIPFYRERHMVKAGLTGWAQVNYPYGASVDDARSKLSYDLYYVKNFSVLFDFVILLQTLRVVLWPSGVR